MTYKNRRYTIIMNIKLQERIKMFGKNNYDERLRKKEMQAKQDRFSIRKLTIGTASVLLGFTFLGLSSQTVKADTVNPSQQIESNSSKSIANSITENNSIHTTELSNDANQIEKTKKEIKLSTFSDLTSFFKSDGSHSEVLSETAPTKDRKNDSDNALENNDSLQAEDKNTKNEGSTDTKQSSSDSSGQSDIDSARNINISNVNNGMSSAVSRVMAAYSKLNIDEQANVTASLNKFIDDIRATQNDAIKKINDSGTKEDIVAIAKNATSKFDKFATTAEVFFAKTAAIDTVNDVAQKVKKELIKESDIEKVESIAKNAKDELTQADDVGKINNIKEEAVNDINNVKFIAEATAKAELEANKTAQKAYISSMAEAAKKRIQNVYDKLSSSVQNDLKDVLSQAITDIDQAEAKTNKDIDAAQSVDDVLNTAGTGNKTIGEIETNTEVAFARVAAKAAIKEVAENAKSGLKKQEDKDKVDAIVDQANKDIDAATSVDSVNSTRDQAINDIKGIKNTLDLKQRLIQARESAIKTVQNRFGKDTDISSIVAAFNDAQIKLNENPQDLTTELNGEKEIAQGALTDAKTAANKLVDGNSDYSGTVKEQIKQQIQKDYDDFSNRVKESAPDSELITQRRDDSIDQLYRDATGIIVNKVENIINGGGSQVIPVTPAPISTNKPDNSKEPEQTKSEKVVLMHNAYLYNNKGQRANGITLGAGSVLDTYGIETINGNQYYVLVDKGANNKKYYVAISNVNSTVRKLKHNAYIYNQYGKRVKKAGKLEAGKAIPTYGNSVKIRGKKYFIIAKNRYVKVANIASQDVTLKQANAGVVAGDQSHMFVTKKVMHNAYLYDQYGVRANGLIINAGSIVAVSAQKVIDSKIYYVLEDGLYIAAGNIDAKKLKLKHNAYVYSKYGNRLGKKVLKKHQTVKTYGKPVKIKGKKYYIMTTSKFVKKANVKG